MVASQPEEQPHGDWMVVSRKKKGPQIKGNSMRKDQPTPSKSITKILTHHYGDASSKKDNTARDKLYGNSRDDSKVVDTQLVHGQHVAINAEKVHGEHVERSMESKKDLGKRNRVYSPTQVSVGPNHKHYKFFTGTRSGSFDPGKVNVCEQLEKEQL